MTGAVGVPAERENEFVFIEEWDSNEALQRHFATSHIREFMQAIPETLVAPPDVKFHNVASTMDLADVERLTSAVGSPFSRWASRKRTGLCGGHSGCTVRPCATATRSHRAQHLRSLACASLTTEEDRAPLRDTLRAQRKPGMAARSTRTELRAVWLAGTLQSGRTRSPRERRETSPDGRCCGR